MMVDNTENNEFTELLSDYAAPIKDDGFSEHIMLQAQTARNTAPLKPIMVGSATLLAALIAAPQLVNLKHVISDVKLPEFSLGIIPLNDMSMSTLAMSTLLAVMAAGVATSLWFSEDM
ncbi:MAG: hypothetical protein JKY25_07640 [Robiginitomaculum sp.]|nr:hypothetical protein [Robiginitomaculum sp.]